MVYRMHTVSAGVEVVVFVVVAPLSSRSVRFSGYMRWEVVVEQNADGVSNLGITFFELFEINFSKLLKILHNLITKTDFTGVGTVPMK